MYYVIAAAAPREVSSDIEIMRFINQNTQLLQEQ